MGTPLFKVNAFAENGSKGNPAAVMILDGPRESLWMQQIANKINFSETAFVIPTENTFQLRWFTPKVEIELCGHATLATAHILWQTGRVDSQQRIIFNTKSGRLTATQEKDIIELDFPASTVVPGDVSEEIIESVGIVPDFIGISGEKWLFEYADELTIRKIQPNFESLSERNGRGLVVTAISDTPGIDFVSRYFAPWVGINEDPVTGSAHCILAAYWGAKFRKSKMIGQQVSSRGGIVHIRLSGERTYIGGKAITVSSTELK